MHPFGCTAWYLFGGWAVIRISPEVSRCGTFSTISISILTMSDPQIILDHFHEMINSPIFSGSLVSPTTRNLLTTVVQAHHQGSLWEPFSPS